MNKAPHILKFTIQHPMPENLTAMEFRHYLGSVTDIYQYAMCRHEISQKYDHEPAQKWGYTFIMNAIGLLSDQLETHYGPIPFCIDDVSMET